MSHSGIRYLRLVSGCTEKAEVLATVRAAIADPDVFYYGAFHDMNCVQLALASCPALLRVLEILSFGTVADLTHDLWDDAKVDREIVTEKMRQLSLLTYCVTRAAGRSELPYDDLQNYLQVVDTAAMEEVVIDAIANNMFKGRLDQRAGVVHVLECGGRDPRMSDISALKEKLMAWRMSIDKQCEVVDTSVASCCVP